MLTAASQYEMLDMAGLEGFVSGGVMPARDVRGDGSWRAMRYEDLLFLAEAYAERKAAVGLTPSSAPPGRTLDAAAFASASWIDPSCVWSADSPEITAAGKYVSPAEEMCAFGVAEIGAEDTISTCGLFGGSAEELVRPSVGEALRADHVRRAYRDLGFLSATMRLVSLPATWTCTSTYTVLEGEPPAPVVTTGSATFGGAPVTVYSQGSASRVGSSSMRYSFAFGSMPSVRWPSACWWVFVAEVAHVVFSGGEESAYTSETRRFVVCRPCGASPSAPSMAAVAAEAAGAAGAPYSAGPVYSERDAVTITIREAALAVDHDFPAEVSSLGWGWTPAE